VEGRGARRERERSLGQLDVLERLPADVDARAEAAG